MHTVVEQMLQKYSCHSRQDYINALKEIFQEIALLGLWRAKFYEKAAFYGGSSLRILYGLNRFSEDLDFTLLKDNDEFDITQYNKAIYDELTSFGFEVSITKKIKNTESNIESAFIKADTKKQLIVIGVPLLLIKQMHHMESIKIKMEIDIHPPQQFKTEVRTLLQPIPFSVRTLTLPDLFAGKIHALLCRPWVTRVKGRDWYDFVWYISRQIPVNLLHLRERLIQTNAWEPTNLLTIEDLRQLLLEKIVKTDFENAKKDVRPFLKDVHSIDLWENHFFKELIDKLQPLNPADS